MKDPRALIELIESLDEDQLETLANLVGGLDRLAMEEGVPVYTADEIDMIGLFANVPQADEDDDEDNKPQSEWDKAVLEAEEAGDAKRRSGIMTATSSGSASDITPLRGFEPLSDPWGNDGDGNSGMA